MKLFFEVHTIIKTVRALKKLLLALFSTTASAFLSLSVIAENEEDEDDSHIRSVGGSINYRTGERDDGTDPFGWYDHK